MKATSKGMIVIADDLTGANDTGVQFARQGMHTEVLLNDAALNATATADIIVVDTNSRAVPAPEAYARVQQAAQKAAAAGFGQYYKKLDSTLRGNVGMEIKAILDLNLHDFALVMPAFPKNGRITVGGNYLLNGAPLSTTEIARDPKTPVYETMLPELLRKQTGLMVGHIDFADISQGQEGIVQAMRRHLNDGCRIISSDAWQDEHFLIVAQAAASISEKILWSGSAGLAEVLLKERDGVRLQIGAGEDAERIHLAGGRGADAVEFADRKIGHEGLAHIGRHHELAVGLAMVGGELGEEFVVGDAG